jgi:predicted dehydrogenase
MKKLKAAIIGYGRSGRDIHTRLLKQLPEMYEIIAYAEADPERRAMIEKEMNVPVYESYRELFKIKNEFDFVVNASFSHEHASISKELMAEGINVLSEKPAARDYDEFQTVLETQKRTGVSYTVFQQYRFSPAFNKVRQLIADGVLGRVVQINLYYDGFARRWDWQTIHKYTAGSLLNTGPHPVDHALTLMGFPEDVGVRCFMDCAHTYGDGEDYVKLLLNAKGVPVVDIEISSCNGFADYTYLVQGTYGSLKGSDKKLEWKYFKEDEAPRQKLILEPLKGEQGEPLYCREKLPMHTDSWEATEEDFNAKGLGFYRAYHKAFTENGDFAVKNEHVALQMKVMQEAHRQNAELFKNARV